MELAEDAQFRFTLVLSPEAEAHVMALLAEAPCIGVISNCSLYVPFATLKRTLLDTPFPLTGPPSALEPEIKSDMAEPKSL